MDIISRFRRQPRVIAILVLACTLVLSLALVVSSHIASLADDGGSKINHYGPIHHSTSPDSGTCGPDWANDTFNRSFTINKSTPNTVIETFGDGTFSTIAGPSPNACKIQSGPNGNGNTVVAGTTGIMNGSFDIAVSNGTFNPKAQCTPSACNTTAGFIKLVYGPNATYTTGTTYFVFDYYTKINGSWHNASTNRGGNNGDITS
jgi:hypothetical protein